MMRMVACGVLGSAETEDRKAIKIKGKRSRMGIQFIGFLFSLDMNFG